MAETITPVVHGGSRTRWALAVAIHTVTATAVASAFGALLGVTGGALGAPWGSGGALVVAAFAVWALAHEAFGVAFPVPQLRQQVPDWWRTFFSPFVSAALYGAGLGIGFFTYLLQATFVVVTIAAFASGRPLVGSILVGAFGLARGLSAVAALGGPDVVYALAAFARRRAPLATIHALACGAVAIAVGATARGSADAPAMALAALAVAFAWSATWKAARLAAWRSIVERYRLGAAAPAVAVAVPAAEAAIVALALTGARRPAAVLALGCLVAFSLAAIRRARFDATRVPCGCFGASETSLATLLARNLALVLAAVIAATGGGAVRIVSPAPSDAVPLALAVAGIPGIVAAAWSVRRSLRGGRV